VVTDGLGLVTLLVAALSAASVLDPQLRNAVGSGVPVLIVLGSLLVGGIAGSLLRLEARLEGLGGWLQQRLSRLFARGRTGSSGTGTEGTGSEETGTEAIGADGTGAEATDRQRFIEGFVTASLVFCVGPLTILGSLQDGLGEGIDQLALKSTLDGFAAIAFAASLGWGVAASAITVALVQGTLTVLGWALGGVLSDAQVSALTATGGLLLVGVGLRLLRIKPVPVADLLPALVIAPVLVAGITGAR
jgi:uncharacterized protein